MSLELALEIVCCLHIQIPVTNCVGLIIMWLLQVQSVAYTVSGVSRAFPESQNEDKNEESLRKP